MPSVEELMKEYRIRINELIATDRLGRTIADRTPVSVEAKIAVGLRMVFEYIATEDEPTEDDEVLPLPARAGLVATLPAVEVDWEPLTEAEGWRLDDLRRRAREAREIHPDTAEREFSEFAYEEHEELIRLLDRSHNDQWRQFVLASGWLAVTREALSDVINAAGGGQPYPGPDGTGVTVHLGEAMITALRYAHEAGIGPYAAKVNRKRDMRQSIEDSTAILLRWMEEKKRG